MRGVPQPPAAQRPRRPWLAALTLLGSLFPGLVALLPLTLGASWYLSADDNAHFLTPGRVWFELVLFVIAVMPFLAAAVSFLSVLLVRRGWVQACRVAAMWAGGLGAVACAAAAVSTGGV